MEHENEENNFYKKHIQNIDNGDYDSTDTEETSDDEEEQYYFKKVLNREGLQYDCDEDINDGFKEDSDTDDSDADDEDY
jgi:hypothetical protein